MDPDLKKRCCNNCKLGGGLSISCEKLKGLKEYQDLCSGDIGPYSFENQVKRSELLNNHTCDDFESLWIEYPLAVKEVKCSEIKYNDSPFYEIGTLVKIRPCGKEYANKTYLGILLGNLPIGINQRYSIDTNILTLSAATNIAIFVPGLKKIIFGCESWWQKIDSPEDLSEITDEQIENQPYIKLLLKLKEKDHD